MYILIIFHIYIYISIVYMAPKGLPDFTQPPWDQAFKSTNIVEIPVVHALRFRNRIILGYGEKNFRYQFGTTVL